MLFSVCLYEILNVFPIKFPMSFQKQRKNSQHIAIAFLHSPFLWGPHIQTPIIIYRAKVNQQPPMHQLAVLSSGCLAFFHSAPDGVHDSPFLFAANHCTFFFGSWSFFPGPDLTHSYLAHFSTFISTTPTLVPYLLSPTNTTTLITSYPIDLATVLTTYPTNLTTLLITYPTLNAILAFWAISKVRMWGSSLFIRRSYFKCNTCILRHFKSTHVRFKHLYTKIIP